MTSIGTEIMTYIMVDFKLVNLAQLQSIEWHQKIWGRYFNEIAVRDNR